MLEGGQPSVQLCVSARDGLGLFQPAAWGFDLAMRDQGVLGSPAVCPLAYTDQPRRLVFSCPLQGCSITCDLGSSGRLAAAGREKPVSCACSQERTYVASIFASSNREGQGFRSRVPWQPEEADPSSEGESCQQARLLVNSNPPERGVALFIGQHAPNSTDRPKEKKKTGQSYLLFL